MEKNKSILTITKDNGEVVSNRSALEDLQGHLISHYSKMLATGEISTGDCSNIIRLLKDNNVTTENDIVIDDKKDEYQNMLEDMKLEVTTLKDNKKELITNNDIVININKDKDE